MFDELLLKNSLLNHCFINKWNINIMSINSKALKFPSFNLDINPPIDIDPT